MPGNDDDEDIVGKRHWNHDADGIDDDNATNTYKMTGTAGMWLSQIYLDFFRYEYSAEKNIC